MLTKLVRTLPFALFLMTMPAFAQLGLPRVPSAIGGNGAASISSGDFYQTFREARVQMNAAEIILAEALGLNEEAALLRAEADRLSQGSITSDEVSSSIQTSKTTQAAITERMNEGEALDGAGKAKMAEAMPPLAVGTILTAQLPEAANNFASRLQSEASSASFSRRVQATRKATTAANLARDIPGFVNQTLSNYRTILGFAETNDIPLPDNATDAL